MSEFKYCEGCSGHDCDDGCAYPGVNKVIEGQCAVPDVPELVRYYPDCKGDKVFMLQSVSGEYVLHSQAAEIIAAKDVELKNIRKIASNAENYGYQQSQEEIASLKAKLAQYEAQEPVVWLHLHPDFTPEFSNTRLTGGDFDRGFREEAVYASPAPAGDLRAGKSDYFMIDDGVSYIHPELGEGVFFTDDLLKPALLENKNHVVTDDVRSLIIAARDVTYSGAISVNSEEYDNLDKALEKFSGDVAWENQP